MQDKLIYVLIMEGKDPKVGHDARTMDLYFNLGDESLRLRREYTYQIPLGIKTYCLPGAPDVVMIPRSSASLIRKHDVGDKFMAPDNVKIYKKAGIELANTVGYIDSGYRGEWIARINYTGNSDGEIITGYEKPFLQAFCTDPEYSFVFVHSENEIPLEYREPTKRGEGGFGSSD